MYLVFDVGGTNLRIGISRTLRRVDRFEVVPTPPTFSEGIQCLVNAARRLAEGNRIRAVSGSTPGHINPRTGKLICSPNLAWGGQPVLRALKKIFHVPIMIENDAAAAGLAEAVFGAGRGARIVAYFTLSTGIGGARIVNGKIDAAAIGFEPGHQIINIHARTADRCSNHHVPGHLEAYASGTAIRRRYGVPAERIRSQRIWHDITRLLAAGIANSILHWSPEVVVVGGGLMGSIPLDKLRADITKNLVRVFRPGPRIVRAALGDRAGLIGALAVLGQHKVNC